MDEVLGEEFAVCAPVRMEVQAGPRSESHLLLLRRLLARAASIEVQPTDYETAAALYRQFRRRRETVRKLINCLIAAIAIRGGVPLLYSDDGFAVLERHTQLRIYRS